MKDNFETKTSDGLPIPSGIKIFSKKLSDMHDLALPESLSEKNKMIGNAVFSSVFQELNMEIVNDYLEYKASQVVKSSTVPLSIENKEVLQEDVSFIMNGIAEKILPQILSNLKHSLKIQEINKINTENSEKLINNTKELTKEYLSNHHHHGFSDTQWMDALIIAKEKLEKNNLKLTSPNYSIEINSLLNTNYKYQYIHKKIEELHFDSGIRKKRENT